MSRSAQYLTEVAKYGANNYKPLPVVISKATSGGGCGRPLAAR